MIVDNDGNLIPMKDLPPKFYPVQLMEIKYYLLLPQEEIYRFYLVMVHLP